MQSPTRILLVDDHVVVRSGLKLLLEAHPDLCVIGEADSGEVALAACRELKPDLVLMDIGLRGMNGLETTRAILRETSEIRVLILTMHEDEAYFSEALSAGAAGYVLKEGTPGELLAAIGAVVAGGGFFHPALARRLVKGPGPEASSGDGLTEREHEILKLTAEGCSTREISGRLFLSPRTVERHRLNVLSKLGLKTRADLIRYAVECGLTSHT